MIVIPMAGLSRRFTDAGYTVPKYMLPLGGKSVFQHAVGSFAALFDDTPFLFIARDAGDTEAFVARECAALGIRDARVALLDAPTAGQAETVEIGLVRARVGDAEPVTIFNIDTFRPGFAFPDATWFAGAADGYLEVFRGSGANWSYVRPDPDEKDRVIETTEKRPVSDLCCTGLYHFARAGDFRAALAHERAHPSAQELYVAPLYNFMVAAGQRIYYSLIDRQAVVFCGVPAEYEALRDVASVTEGNAVHG